MRLGKVIHFIVLNCKSSIYNPYDLYADIFFFPLHMVDDNSEIAPVDSAYEDNPL